ncbi:LolA family protein [Halopiger xanaduensis]|uniref:Outer membrane lipoprotein carrier protein LolA n=1 Tax=Halopiger xanaduensis (strain DSM 18323 / JCM 14033 / SH-6) TaxID=797210 RepID=F8DDR6_HALXS|nr:hypothetical protein [Halopiger xanaduensis]AEH39169.1 hypothetical protein Halxa_0579 [Halopiger xanaduensis SH-6]
MAPNFAGTRAIPAAIAVLFAVLLAGCVAVPSTGVSDASLETRITEATPPAELAATVEINHTIDGETTTVREDVQFRADGASRIETGDGVVIVSNGSTRWQYDRDADTAQRLEVDPNASSFLEGVYAHQQRYVERYEIESIEETTIDGRETYRVAFDPPANESIGRSVTVLVGDTEYAIPLQRDGGDVDGADRSTETVAVWFDQDHLFPVKHRVAGESVSLETTYRNLTVDPGFDDDRFEFEPPTDENGSESVDEIALPSIESYETVDAAADAVPFSVAEPSAATVPDALALDEITSYEFPDEERKQVSLSYRGDGETITVTTSDGPRLFARGGDNVSIGDATGTIADTDEGTELEWSCGGATTNGDLYYSIFVSDGLADDRHLALEIGRALEC